MVLSRHCVVRNGLRTPTLCTLLCCLSLDRHDLVNSSPATLHNALALECMCLYCAWALYNGSVRRAYSGWHSCFSTTGFRWRHRISTSSGLGQPTTTTGRQPGNRALWRQTRTNQRTTSRIARTNICQASSLRDSATRITWSDARAATIIYRNASMGGGGGHAVQ